MIIVGEKINASRPSITEAVAKRDADYVVRVARAQAAAGASFVDVNAGTFLDHEADYLCWLVETIQTELDVPLCLDCANPRALTEAMKRHKGEPMINSISLEEETLPRAPAGGYIPTLPCGCVVHGEQVPPHHG